MKYQCSDGVNRDIWIDTVLLLEEEVEKIKCEIAHLTRRLEAAERSRRDISFKHLGMVGHVALEKEKQLRKPRGVQV